MRRVLAVLLGIVLSAGWLGAAEPVAGQCVFLGEAWPANRSPIPDGPLIDCGMIV